MTERSGLLEERRVFAALVDLLLPASGDGRMPAASELGLPDRWRGETPGAGEGLASIAAEARTRNQEFPDLAAAEQADVVAALGRRRWRSFTPLATAIFERYYQQDPWTRGARVRRPRALPRGVPGGTGRPDAARVRLRPWQDSHRDPVERARTMLLQGKTAVVTGCNRGIRRVILETFAGNGADVLACVRKGIPLSFRR